MSHARRTDQQYQLRDLAAHSTHNQWISEEVEAKLDAFIRAHPEAVGAVEERALVMPLSDTKGTKLTWQKALARVVTDLENTPSGPNACWLIKASRSGTDCSGYHLWRMGNTSRFRTHRVLHCIYNPDWYQYVADRGREQHLSHRCGWGKANSADALICISPHHVVYHSSAANQDHKGCKYGCAQTCPHQGFCVWTWPDTGEPKRCFNQPLMPAACPCPRTCKHEITAADHDE